MSAPEDSDAGARRNNRLRDHWRCPTTADLLPAEARNPRAHRTAYRAHCRSVQVLPVGEDDIGTVTAVEATRATRQAVSDDETRRASRGWWDGDADNYQAEHGDFLGDVDFVWCPEGLREADARLLGDVRRRRVLEVGCGAAAAARWLVTQGAEVVGMDLSAGMLRHARAGAEHSRVLLPLIQADVLALPFAAGSFDVACTAFGAIPFIEDSALAMREVHRVLRPGGRWVFSVTHPMRWIFLDDPGEG